MTTPIKQLLAAKAHSDRRQYDEKTAILRRMMKEAPEEFMVDSESDGIYGLTHIPTGFKIHLPKEQVADLLKAASVVRTVPLLVKSAMVHAEIADTEELQKRGLAYRDSLPEDHGMLFWMKGVSFPIDLVPLSKSGGVLGCRTMAVEPDPEHPAALYRLPPDVKLALELPGGWGRKHNLEIGDMVLVNGLRL